MSTFIEQQLNYAPSCLSAGALRDFYGAPKYRGFVKRVESSSGASEEGSTESNEPDEGLDDAVRDEHEYLRRRLRDELKREPTEEELDEWLRQHTEGY
jgi:hypothetical protein